MTGVVALVVGLVVFWLLAYVSKRRFGVLGLALAAGALISRAWSDQLLGLLERADVTLASLSMTGVVSICLVLLPAAVLLFSGPAYQNKRGRVVGAILFATLATTLVAEPISSMLVLDTLGRTVFDYLAIYHNYIITVGVVLAVLEVLAIHTVGGKGKSKSKH